MKVYVLTTQHDVSNIEVFYSRKDAEKFAKDMLEYTIHEKIVRHNKYPYEITNCPGYQPNGVFQDDDDRPHTCKNCGQIAYYH